MAPYLTSHGDDDAPLLLCLHGIGSCAGAFEPQNELASRLGRRLVAWDAPGYRNSPDPVPPFTLDDWADAAAEVIRKQSPDGTADLLGVSWGGVTATRLTLRHPDLVRTLVLADSSVGAGTDPEVAAAMKARATAVDSTGLEAFAHDRAPLLLTPDAPVELIREMAEMMITSVRQPSYTWACASMADTDHRSQLASIPVPTLVVYGDQDVVTPPARSEELAAGIPNAELVSIPGAGHLANQQVPELFNQIVANFLTNYPPSDQTT